MEWPQHPVESLPPEEFVPEHCPWPECPSNRSSRPFRFHRHGAYVRKGNVRTVPRCRCLTCGRTFSLQTFAVTYYLKRAELAVPVAAGLNAGSAHRQLARSLGCAPSTVTRLAARLGRHALLLSAHLLEQLSAIREPVVFDHFESFAYSQDYPIGIGTPVGQDSWFVYGIEAATRRRGGKLSPVQKARRKALKIGAYATPGSYGRSVRQMLDRLLPKVGDGDHLEIVSDGHSSYRREIERHPERTRIRHRIHPNPPRGPKGSPRSPGAKERDRQMFAVDLLHLLARHSLAHHRRETIAFGRRHNALMERAFLMTVWRNLVKRSSERKPNSGTPAMTLGLTDEPWSWPRVLARRLFPWRVAVPPSWMKIYRRAWITPALPVNRPHALKYAF
jgi:transposase-like protein